MLTSLKNNIKFIHPNRIAFFVCRYPVIFSVMPLHYNDITNKILLECFVFSDLDQ